VGLNPSSLTYGSVFIDTSTPSTQTATISNTGTGNLNVSGITIGGGGGAYRVTSSPAVPFTLAPNQTAAIAVTFDPVAGGTAIGQIRIVSNAANSISVISLNGSGVHWASLAWTASASPEIAFHKVYWASVSGGPYSLIGTPTGTTYVDSHAGLVPGSPDYYVVTAVDNTGAESSHSNQAPALIPAVASHSVSLRWTASASSGVVSNNVYWAPVSGGPYTLIASTTGTTYIDAESGLVGGSAAYFVVTAVDSTGAESSYSSEARALIPTS
jgi:hypothetical protein